MDSSPLILAIETATRAGSICLANGPIILESITGDPSLSHSNSLLIDVDRLLDETDRTLDEIDLFAAAVGPGSFTGLRIGLATVKALASTLKRPCVGISTLEAIAYLATQSGDAQVIVSLLPAGRGELFVQAFSASDKGSVSQLDRAAHLSPASVLERYQNFGSVIWAGEGAQGFNELIASHAQSAGIAFGKEDAGAGKKRWTIASEHTNLAAGVAALGMNRFENGLLEDAETLRAIYVRPSDAELTKNVLSN